MSSWIVIESAPLSQSQMENNVNCLVEFFQPAGWSVNAISALAGNMEAESAINPGRWESDDVGNLSGGFGLVQWTPATNVRDWIQSYLGSTDYTNGGYQCQRIIYELDNGLQYYPTSNYPETFSQFSVSTKSPGYLAKAFLLNYERPADQSPDMQAYRASLAEKWYTYITGQPAPKNTPAWLLAILSKTARRLKP